MMVAFGLFLKSTLDGAKPRDALSALLADRWTVIIAVIWSLNVAAVSVPKEIQPELSWTVYIAFPVAMVAAYLVVYLKEILYWVWLGVMLVVLALTLDDNDGTAVW